MSGPGNSDLLQIRYFPNMKHKPHSLTICLGILSGAIIAGLVPLLQVDGVRAAQDSGDSASQTAPAADPGITTVVTDLKASDIFEDMRNRLESIGSLQCDLHETVHLSDQWFYAIGRYVQASGNRVRLEFRIYPIRGVRRQDAEYLAFGGLAEDPGKKKPTGELTQVSNGSVLWSLWKNGDSRRLTRRNIREILEAADAAENFERTGILHDLGAGGLQALLARLQTGMEFGKVRQRITGETRLLVLSGRWTRKALKQYFSISDTETQLSPWIPDYVRVYVDADARLPRRIQYLKRHPDPEEKTAQPLVTLDFRKMKINDSVDDSLFEFSAPEGIVEEDLTQQTVEAIRQVAGQIAQSDESPVDSEAVVESGSDPVPESN